MRIWYDVSDEGVHLSITRLVAPDDWTPESDSRTYSTWAEARHDAIERQRWVLRTRQYDPATFADPAIESLWPERNDQAVTEMRDHIEGLLKDLEDAPDDEHGFVVFEESRLSRLFGRIDNLPRTEVVSGRLRVVADANTSMPAVGEATGSRGTVALLPRAGEVWDGSVCAQLRDELAEALDGYRGRCVVGGNDVTLMFVVPVRGRLANEIRIDLLGLQNGVPALRFEGTVAPPPFASRQQAVAWVESLVNLLIEDGPPV